MHGISGRENTEIAWSPGGLIAGRAARGTLRHARGERWWEVRRPRSTCEAAEEHRATGGGGGGGKGAGRGERGQQNACRTQSRTRRVKCAWSRAPSGVGG